MLFRGKGWQPIEEYDDTLRPIVLARSVDGAYVLARKDAMFGEWYEISRGTPQKIYEPLTEFFDLRQLDNPYQYEE